jgi:CRP-like cAMP-binding protein
LSGSHHPRSKAIGCECIHFLGLEAASAGDVITNGPAPPSRFPLQIGFVWTRSASNRRLPARAEGEEGSTMFILIRGAVDVHTSTRALPRRLKNGDSFGELALLAKKKAALGLGRIVAQHYHSSALYHIH